MEPLLQPELLTLNECSDIYVDGVIVDSDHHLLFLSAWGQDTALQELLARLSLSVEDGGLNRLTLMDKKTVLTTEIGNPQRLRKHTGRAAKDCHFDGLIHLWLYDVLAMYMDRANRRCLLLKHPAESEQDFFWRLWQAVREICHIPLLEEWHFLVSRFRQKGWIQQFSGRGADAYRIDLSSEEVERYISYLVQSGECSLLTVSKQPAALLPTTTN